MLWLIDTDAFCLAARTVMALKIIAVWDLPKLKKMRLPQRWK